jgi:phasin
MAQTEKTETPKTSATPTAAVSQNNTPATSASTQSNAKASQPAKQATQAKATPAKAKTTARKTTAARKKAPVAKATKVAAKTADKSVKQSTKAAREMIRKMEGFNMNTHQFPDMFREMAEKGVTQARDTYSQVRNAAEDATEILEETVETARKSYLDINARAIDAAKSNADATFKFVKDFMSVKSLSEAVELQTAFARDRFDAFTKQAKDMQGLTQKMAEETSKPAQKAVSKTMKLVKAA